MNCKLCGVSIADLPDEDAKCTKCRYGKHASTDTAKQSSIPLDSYLRINDGYRIIRGFSLLSRIDNP